MRARLVACVLLLAGAVTGGAPCLAWPVAATEHTCCTPVHCPGAMAEPMAAAESVPPPLVISATPNAPAGQSHGMPRCCITDRDPAQPQSARTLSTTGDWSSDLQSARVSLHSAAMPSPRPLRDPVPLAPSSTARHVLFSVFIV